MSRRRHCVLLRKYWDSPERKSLRVMTTSEYCTGSIEDALSKVSVTSAMDIGGRLAVPAKMTSVIVVARRDFQDISPRHQRTDSITFDFPQPFGPMTPVMPGSRSTCVFSAKDL
jgi:hypothetical protein